MEDTAQRVHVATVNTIDVAGQHGLDGGELAHALRLWTTSRPAKCRLTVCAHDEDAAVDYGCLVGL